MAELFGFDREHTARIVRAVRKIEGLARERGKFDGDGSGFAFEQPLTIFKHEALASSDIIPIHGSVAVIGSTLLDGLQVPVVQLASTTFRRVYMVNGLEVVPNNEYGLGYSAGQEPIVLYSTAPTTSLEGYGPKPGSWAWDKNYPQIGVAFGVIDATTLSMRASMGTIRELLVKNTSDTFGTTSRSLEVWSGAGGSETTQTGWRVTVYNKGGTIESSAFFVIQEVDGQWYPTGAGGADVKLAVSDQNKGVYATSLFQIWNASTEFVVFKDFQVDAEAAGTTPDQKVRLFIDSNAIAGYNSGAAQYLTKDSTDDLTWSTGLPVTTVDERLAASSENDGTYWSGLHEGFNASAVFSTVQDLRIESEVTGTTPSQDIIIYADMSDVRDWTATADQFLMTDSSAGLLFRQAVGVNVSTVFNSVQDMSVELEIVPSGDLTWFVDVSDISGYSTADNLFLNSSNGTLRWTTKPASTSADVKLAATAQNFGVYWDGLHNEYGAAALSTGKDLLVESEVAGTTPNQTIRMYVDCSDITGYSAGAEQFLSKDTSDFVKWSTLVDERVACTSENNGDYLAGVLQDFNASTVYNTTSDLLVESEVVGTTPDQNMRFYVDVSDIDNYSTSAEQYLTNSSGVTEWTTFPGVDEKLAASSENDGVYWGGLHADFNASTVFTSLKDLLVESELTGTTPNQDIKLYVDCSDISGYNGTVRQFLSHDSSGFLQWVGVSTCT